MNLAISNIAWLPEQRFEVYALMQKLGFTGLEIAPALFQRVSDAPYGQQDSIADAAVAELQDYGLRLVSMQALHFGEAGMALFETATEREKLLDYTKRGIDFACRLGIRNLVFGSPKLRNIPEDMPSERVDEIAIPFFTALAQHASAQGCVIGLEPNAAEYGTNFINTTQEALELIKMVDHAGLMLNLDMGNLIANSTDLAILNEAAPIVSHVHYSLPMLRTIEKTDAPTLHEFARTLRTDVAESVYFSIEMGRSSLKSIEHALDFLRKIE